VTLRGRTATYNYDIAGRLTDKTLPNGLKAVYQYDAADRVTSIAYMKPNNTALESVTYSYDAGGQRINKTEGQVPPQDTGFAATYDEANRLATITIAGEVFTLSYDANGNLTTKSGPVSGITTYTWGARNQLLSLSGRSGTASFRYDAMGRRTEKTVNGSTTGFLYDGTQAIAELRGGAVDTIYHNGLAIDEVLARYASSGNKTLLTDALMSVIAQANDAQSVDNYYAYSPYGEATTLGPDGGNSIQYTGRENDGTGLYYYRARYYDAVLKRFVSEDPIGLGGGANVYVYVKGSPANFRDPLGLLTLQVGLSINVQIGPVTLQGSAGIAVDDKGNFGTYDYYGAGVGVGERVSGGLSVALSNAKTICDLAGAFNNVSIGGGVGPGGSLDGFIGSSANGPVVGGGFTVGGGLGGGISSTITNTTVGGLNCVCP
jgi:RHS repeat-associated protein